MKGREGTGELLVEGEERCRQGEVSLLCRWALGDEEGGERVDEGGCRHLHLNLCTCQGSETGRAADMVICAINGVL